MLRKPDGAGGCQARPRAADRSDPDSTRSRRHPLEVRLLAVRDVLAALGARACAPPWAPLARFLRRERSRLAVLALVGGRPS